MFFKSVYEKAPKHIRQEDCAFYHCMDIPGIGEVTGQWDLRATVDRYLGDVNFSSKRVLEIGPASGFLTVEMEKRGADVVAVDLPEGVGWDFVPWPDAMLNPIREARIAGIRQLKAGFWLNYAANKSKAKVVYADVYDLPEALGEFDIAVLASVLLHCQCPAKIIEQCTRRAKTLVITEPYRSELEGPVCRLCPSLENKNWDTWWDFSPEFFTQYLGVLGYIDPIVSLHSHKHVPSQDGIVMFSVVASRP